MLISLENPRPVAGYYKQVAQTSTRPCVCDLGFICAIALFSVQNANKAAHKFTLQLDVLMPAIPALLTLKGKDSCKFEVKLGLHSECHVRTNQDLGCRVKDTTSQ